MASEADDGCRAEAQRAKAGLRLASYPVDDELALTRKREKECNA